MRVNDILSIMQAYDLVRLHDGEQRWLLTACDLYASDSDDKERIVIRLEADSQGVINLYL